ncbi:MAG: phosphoribosylanthranilate isomerase [Acetobacteraceae bacterium]|jgi:phosphoribosylanthranilate isomerase|nr:phosphoribosylanthranilate isomerase [Acetobacteraceae bacterium]
MLTQIYEISSPEEARAVSIMGVDHIGILVGDGEFPREQSVAAATKIAAAIVAPAKFSALFLTADTSLIMAWVRELQPSILHLGASPDLLSPAQTAMLKKELPNCLIMRSVPVSGEESLSIAQSYDGIADYLLLDSYRSSDRQVGALGVTHDWSISRRIVDLVRIPVVLAGGLGPDNVVAAIRAVVPSGVDSKTKTDQDGSHAKDLERVRRFTDVVRATPQ